MTKQIYCLTVVNYEPQYHGDVSQMNAIEKSICIILVGGTYCLLEWSSEFN